MKTIDTYRIDDVTLVGYMPNSYPTDRGNCFSLIAKGDNIENYESYRIDNFNYENLKELLRLGLTFPIKIEIIESKNRINGIAAICDSRIGKEWYSTKFCRSCCGEYRSEQELIKQMSIPDFDANNLNSIEQYLVEKLLDKNIT